MLHSTGQLSRLHVSSDPNVMMGSGRGCESIVTTVKAVMME